MTRYVLRKGNWKWEKNYERNRYWKKKGFCERENIEDSQRMSNMSIITFFFLFRSHPVFIRVYSWFCAHESVLVGLEDGMPGIKCGLDMCKGCALLTVLSLLSLDEENSWKQKQNKKTETRSTKEYKIVSKISKYV